MHQKVWVLKMGNLIHLHRLPLSSFQGEITLSQCPPQMKLYYLYTLDRQCITMSEQENILATDHAYFFCSFYFIVPCSFGWYYIQNKNFVIFSVQLSSFYSLQSQYFPQQGTLFSSFFGNNYSLIQWTERKYIFCFNLYENIET